MPSITTRSCPAGARAALEQAGLAPTWARLYATRGVTHPEQIAHRLSQLLPPGGLLHIERAAVLLADAIDAKKRLLIIADYDADGATACAVGLRALRSMGASVDYLVPNRFELGYGLTPELVDIAGDGEYPTPWFVREHRQVDAATWKSPAVKSVANCTACHAGAASGDYNERAVRIPR